MQHFHELGLSLASLFPPPARLMEQTPHGKNEGTYTSHHWEACTSCFMTGRKMMASQSPHWVDLRRQDYHRVILSFPLELGDENVFLDQLGLPVPKTLGDTSMLVSPCGWAKAKKQ